jgi:hypothetical protein
MPPREVKTISDVLDTADPMKLYRVLAEDGITTAETWKSAERLVIAHWDAMYRAVYRDDTVRLVAMRGVAVWDAQTEREIPLSCDPAMVRQAERDGVADGPLGLRMKRGVPAPYVPRSRHA